MNLKTGLSIYNKQWLVEPEAALRMLDFWEQVKEGKAEWSYRAANNDKRNGVMSEYATYQKLFAKQDVVMAPDNSWDLEDFTGFDGASVAVIPVTGPIMKSDYCGSCGTNTLRGLAMKADATESVKCIVFLIDSPGGTVDGTAAFADTIKGLSKKSISVVDGVMCSAAYWIGSSADEVYASNKTDIIGSIGTMISFYDNTEAMKSRGVVLREYYASESKDKNKAYNEAIKGDGKALIQELLDPINNVFLGSVKSMRDVNPKALTGKTFLASDAKNMKLIDDIKSFESVVREAAMDVKVKTEDVPNYILIKQENDKTMTAAEFKAANPAAYAEILAEGAKEGVKQEQARVKAWMQFSAIDSESVQKGIEGGSAVDMTVISEMTAKAVSADRLGKMKAENAPSVQTPAPAASEPTADEKNTADFLANCKKELGLK